MHTSLDCLSSWCFIQSLLLSLFIIFLSNLLLNVIVLRTPLQRYATTCITCTRQHNQVLLYSIITITCTIKQKSPICENLVKWSSMRTVMKIATVESLLALSPHTCFSLMLFALITSYFLACIYLTSIYVCTLKLVFYHIEFRCYLSISSSIHYLQMVSLSSITMLHHNSLSNYNINLCIS